MVNDKVINEKISQLDKNNLYVSTTKNWWLLNTKARILLDSESYFLAEAEEQCSVGNLGMGGKKRTQQMTEENSFESYNI